MKEDKVFSDYKTRWITIPKWTNRSHNMRDTNLKTQVMLLELAQIIYLLREIKSTKGVGGCLVLWKMIIIKNIIIIITIRSEGVIIKALTKYVISKMKKTSISYKLQEITTYLICKITAWVNNFYRTLKFHPRLINSNKKFRYKKV